MNSLITYILELNISITVLYLIYLIFFNKDSNFNIRRFYLLMSMLIASILPLLHVQFPESTSGISNKVILIEELVFTGSADMVINTSQSFNIGRYIGYIYLFISLLFISRLIILVSGIIFRTIRAEKTYLFEQKVYSDKKLHASSFFNIIFIDTRGEESEDMKHIVDHEVHHANLMHSFDRIFSEIILSISWLNPVVWMFRKSMIVNHEYQADNRVIEQGTDQISYQLSILNQYIGCATISNQFSSQIKNRIKMLNKSYKKGSFWKTLMILPVSALLFTVVSCDNEPEALKNVADEAELSEVQESEMVKKSAEEEIFYIVEEMPKWKDTEEEMPMMVRKFIAKNLKYPDDAKENGVQGKVYIKFLVTSSGDVIVPDPSMLPPEKNKKDGELEEVVVVTYRPIGEDGEQVDEKYIKLLQDEAIRVINLLPDMEPGKQRGKAVSVMYTMPINFVLQ